MSGHTATIGRHRLVALAFKYPGAEADHLWVNHINGIKGDDRADNLEWVTPQGNIHHAGLFGLTSKCCPVSVREVDSGKVLEFLSIIDCANYFGMSKDSIQYRLRFGETRVFPERRQYRLSFSNSPWYIPTESELSIIEHGNTKRVSVLYVFIGRVVEFDSLTDLATRLGVSLSTVSQWMQIPGYPVLSGFIMIKWANDPTPWRSIEDPYLELSATLGNCKIVQVVNDKTKEITVYLSARECAVANNLKPTALNYRLRSNGNVVFSDGNRYGYYPYKSKTLHCPTNQ